MSEVGRDLWRWSTRVAIAKRQPGLAVERALWGAQCQWARELARLSGGAGWGLFGEAPSFPPLLTLPNSFDPFAIRDQVWSLQKGQAITLTLTRNTNSARARRELLW